MIDEEARDELFNLGVRSTPALVVDGEVVAFVYSIMLKQGTPICK